jgi:hypothetical protein
MVSHEKRVKVAAFNSRGLRKSGESESEKRPRRDKQLKPTAERQERPTSKTKLEHPNDHKQLFPTHRFLGNHMSHDRGTRSNIRFLGDLSSWEI